MKSTEQTCCVMWNDFLRKNAESTNLMVIVMIVVSCVMFIACVVCLLS